MDQPTIIDEKVLRRIIQSRTMPHTPAFMTERIMRKVRREQERMLRRERRLFFAPVVVAILALLALGIGCWLHIMQSHFTPTPRDKLLAAFLGVTYLLHELQRWLCKRWGLPD